MRPVFVLDVSEAAIDLLSRERFIDDYCNVLTANGRSLPEIDPDESPEETDIRLYHAAVTEIQKDPAIRIADTAASLPPLLALLDELSAVLRRLSVIRRAENEAQKTHSKEKR